MNSQIVKINDPACLSIPVKENNETMLTLLDLERLFLVSQTKVVSENIEGDSAHPFARKTVKNMLKKAISSLPKEYGIVLVESYRKYDFQKYLFSTKVNSLIKEKGLSQTEAKKEATKFVSNPDMYSPHVTGAALDIGLIYLNTKELVDVGNNFAYNESGKTSYQNLTIIQKKNRELLTKIMVNAGFANYPLEWWHWSYGDKYWAYVKKETFAIYDSLKGNS